ncbi:phosphatidate cytidylyltransferase [Trinickia caryophylli]|uniref:Phosphatidate cytidylyltransferase n=1 Tax=Trinickia caryophylli TaxID=28094 RepID=A0A1X7DKY8_TRICW|nr:phosphatidate cytidylyltransferase [Trinickia caryophylli]PMS12242.1 phosphatidate cytidylyltransferase [Trinickia caryophylli]TRX17091.1 phosphatidate cytidylyltransferase [Trinickia caryophylli]WQE12175.1 phosphatidate cytidylyltransferase [Trinickia caryophylli]SMF16893.1 phosphatidate cytidylyltransferase [Trinickia caryophylli]GLU31691.1 phosphatidate cytidylyltransferase [Trinickia caryophylli]
MLKTRVATALVLLAVFVPVTLYAPIGAFGALIGLVVVLAAWEWARLLKLPAAAAIGYAAVAALAVAASTRLPPGPRAARPLFEAAAVFWVLAGPFVLVRKPQLAHGAWRLFLFLTGLLLFVACWHALVVARAMGVSFVLSVLLVVWLADIGAYFAGKGFGRHKLAPAISPGKTWEGALGGWLAVMIAGVVAIASQFLAPTLFTVLGMRLGWGRACLALTFLVAFSIVGDLFESLLKRQAGVKDSSGLLPGHGGVLDRIDALLPVLPLAMLLIG